MLKGKARNLETMNMSALVSYHNQLAEGTDVKPVTRFATRAAGLLRVKKLAEARCAAICTAAAQRKAPTSNPAQRVRALQGGKTTLQEKSIRRAVFMAVAAAGESGIDVNALSEQSGFPVRGHLSKLRAGGHIEFI
jgi:hypothetical protein